MDGLGQPHDGASQAPPSGTPVAPQVAAVQPLQALNVQSDNPVDVQSDTAGARPPGRTPVALQVALVCAGAASSGIPVEKRKIGQRP